MTVSPSSARRHRTAAAALCLVAAACPLVVAQGLQEFGPPKGKAALRTFGNPVGEDALRQRFPRVTAAVNADDRQEAAREMQRTDANGDGVVTQAEWNASGYQSPNRFHYRDLNRDGFFTLFELCLSRASYRTGGEQALKATEAATSQAAYRSYSSDSRSTASWSGASSYQERRLARSRRLQIDGLTSQAMATYDRNHNRRIEKSEFHGRSQFGDLTKADADNDGAITPAELFTWLSELLAAQPSPKAPDNAPDWFSAADEDADGQVRLSEYRRYFPNEDFTAFEQFDRNADGFVTAVEATSSLAADVIRFPSTRPAVVEAETDTLLDLFITEDLSIGDIDVQLALVKNDDDDLDLFLIAPDGTRADLYYEPKAKPWNNGSLFTDTLIDDEIPAPPQRLARPPLFRAFPSQGSTIQVQHGQQARQGLKSLYGKNARGTWQLHIRNPSQSAGFLEGWALLMKPAEPAPSAEPTAPAEPNAPDKPTPPQSPTTPSSTDPSPLPTTLKQ